MHDYDQPAPFQLDTDADFGCAAVLDGVGHAFLHNAVNGIGFIHLQFNLVQHAVQRNTHARGGFGIPRHFADDLGSDKVLRLLGAQRVH